MRLIDVDTLIEALDDEILWSIQGWEDVTSVIYAQPTAYDVDKVVEELKSHHGDVNKALYKEYIGMVSILTAIDIVKGGGITK